MAVQPCHSRSNSVVADCAPRLLDFDWSLKYAVASGSIASVEKPLLRVELYVSNPSSVLEEPGVLQENQMQTSVAEFTKEELESVIVAMDAIEQALEGADSENFM